MIMGNKSVDGTISIAVSVAFGIIIYYSFKFLLSHLTLKSEENPYTFLIRMIIIIIVATNIEEILGTFLKINSLFTKEILKLNSNPYSKETFFSIYVKNLQSNIYNFENGIDFTTFDGILKIFISSGLVTLLFEYAYRYMLVIIMLIISPIMIIFKVIKNTEYIFYSWLKTIVALLFMQNIAAIILMIITYITPATSNISSKLIFIGVIYALIKSNQITNDLLGGMRVQTNISGKFLRGG